MADSTSESAPVAGPSSSAADKAAGNVPFSDQYPAIVPGGYLCIAWVLKGKRVLIVGGGPVAAGRLVNVKDADAHVTVICPSSGLNGEMKYRLARGEIDEYHDRLFGGEQELDLPASEAAEGEAGADGESASVPSSSSKLRRTRYDLVLTATDDIALSRAICEMCRARRIPVNVADVPPECDFYFGSLIRRGPLQVMVSTGGKGPKIANQVRTRLERALPAELAGAITNVGVLRARLRQVAPLPQQGGRRMRWMIDVCERWTWVELAQMEEGDMDVVLRGWESGSVPSFSECRRRRRREGTLGQGRGPGAVVLGGAIDTARTAKATLSKKCPITGDMSPWLAGLIGFSAGIGVTASALLIRAKVAGPR